MSNSYNVRNRFFDSNINSIFKAKLDQETYLTFSLSFGAFLRDYVPGSWNSDSFKSSNYDELPQALFCPDYEYSEDWNSRNGYCAYTYLLDRNENLRAEMLLEFLKGWDDLQNYYQFYFQEISGLDSILKVDTKAGVRVKDGKIRIKCLEGIDLKVKYLLNLYKKIAWDDVYQRWVLPDIYRYFKMYIYISEIRTFHESNFSVEGKVGDGIEPMILRVIDNLVPTTRIKCSMCEFLLDSWLEDSYSINNNDAESTTFEISVKNIEVDSTWKLNNDIQRVLSDEYDRVISKRVAEGLYAPDHSMSTVLPFDAYANRSLMLSEADRISKKWDSEDYGPGTRKNGWFSNAVAWGKAFITNLVNREIDKLKTKNIVGNLSLTGVVNALQSKDFVTVFSAVKQATRKVNIDPSFEIEGHDLMTSIIKGIAASTATSEEQEKLIDAAKEMLKAPYLIDAANNMTSEELLEKLSNYEMKSTYEVQSKWDRSHATDLDGYQTPINLVSNKFPKDDKKSPKLENTLLLNHKEFMQLTDNIHEGEVVEQELTPNIHDIKLPEVELTSNVHDIDRSLATDSDGLEDSTMTSNVHDPEVAEMTLISNAHEGDRSLATDLDGLEDSTMTFNIHDPEVTNMDLIPNTYEGDRSLATDLDGLEDSTMTSNVQDPKVPEMNLISNAYEGDRSLATDLDGLEDSTMTSNVHEPEVVEMTLTFNVHDIDRSLATDLDGLEDPTMTNNIHDIDRSLATDLDGLENPNLTSNVQDPKAPGMDLTSNVHDIDRSLATDLDGLENPNMTSNVYDIDRSLATDLDGLEDSTMTSNIHDPKVPEMNLISNAYEGDRSLATDLDGLEDSTMTSNVHDIDRSLATDLDGLENPNMTSNIHDPKVVNMNLTSNVHDIDRSLATDLDGLEDSTMTSNVHDPKAPGMDLTSNVHDIDRSLATDLDGLENPGLTANVHDPEVSNMSMISNIHDIDRSLATDLDGLENPGLTANVHDPEVAEMPLIPNAYGGDRSLATDLDGLESYSLVSTKESKRPSRDIISGQYIIDNNLESKDLIEKNSHLTENSIKDLSRPMAVPFNLGGGDVKEESLTRNEFISPLSESEDLIKNINDSLKDTLNMNLTSNFANKTSIEESKTIEMTQPIVSENRPIQILKKTSENTEKNEESFIPKTKLVDNGVPEMKLTANKYYGPKSLATSVNTIE